MSQLLIKFLLWYSISLLFPGHQMKNGPNAMIFSDSIFVIYLASNPTSHERFKHWFKVSQSWSWIFNMHFTCHLKCNNCCLQTCFKCWLAEGVSNNWLWWMDIAGDSVPQILIPLLEYLASIVTCDAIICSTCWTTLQC